MDRLFGPIRRVIRRRVLVMCLCVLALFVVIALGAATCAGYSSPSSPSTPGGGPTPTNNSGY